MTVPSILAVDSIPVPRTLGSRVLPGRQLATHDQLGSGLQELQAVSSRHCWSRVWFCTSVVGAQLWLLQHRGVYS